MALPPKHITIYSVGLLGGSLALALKSSGYKGKIVGLSSPRNLDAAFELSAIDEGGSYDDLGQVVQETDLLFLCSPITAIISTLKKLKDFRLPKGLIITDIGSTKREVVEAAISLPEQVSFIGGHPLAGSEKSGAEHSDPYLFQNAVYVLTPKGEEADEQEKALASFLARFLGCRNLFLAPDEHDRIAGAVSHLPQLLSVALANVAHDCEEKTPGTLQLAAGGFRDMTRIAASPFGMWRDILATNSDTVSKLLQDCIDSLQKMKSQLAGDGLANHFTRAAKTRSRAPLGGKGFLKKLHDILIVANDEPGVIASISASLHEASINIKDIEVLKVREGEGASIRMAFECRKEAEKAAKLIKELGFQAWRR